MWSTGEGNGKPLQYSCLENPMNSMNSMKNRHIVIFILYFGIFAFYFTILFFVREKQYGKLNPLDLEPNQQFLLTRFFYY